jgi:hypothetical protein
LFLVAGPTWCGMGESGEARVQQQFIWCGNLIRGIEAGEYHCPLRNTGSSSSLCLFGGTYLLTELSPS